MGILRRAALVLLPSSIALALPGQAVAQIAPTMSGTSSLITTQNTQAFLDLADFGRCFVRSSPTGAIALIGMAPGSEEENQFFRRMVSRELGCMAEGTTFNVSDAYIRGVIAEAMLTRGVSLPSSLVLPAPTVGEVRGLHDVARCYASGHRSQVQALLATHLGSAEESAAVSALWNDFRACLPPNARVRLNAPWIRFLLAEAMLRLPRVAASPS